MKKIVFFSLLLCTVSIRLFSDVCEEKKPCFSGALSAGYVFKRDHAFKKVYGPGIVNVITADGCYYPLQCLGLGAKLSYWQGNGKTTFLKQHARVQELPVTFYLRGVHNFCSGVRLYASLGGGIIWFHEKSYLGKVQFNKGIGEVEVGCDLPIWRFINITTAFRYLFPRQSQFGHKIDVGGFDLRAGIEFLF